MRGERKGQKKKKNKKNFTYNKRRVLIFATDFCSTILESHIVYK